MNTENNNLKNNMGFVRFDSDPKGSSIFIDGSVLVDPDTEETIKTPAKVELPVGRRDFVYRLHGYDDTVGYVDVIADTTVNINRNLKLYTGKTITPLEKNKNDKINKINSELTKKVLVSDKDVPSILQQLLESNNKLVQLIEEQSKKQDVKYDKKSKELTEQEQKEERIRDGRGDEAVSRGDIKTKSYRDYYDRHHTIVTANATDPNDPDSLVYTTNADQIDQIYITLGRNAEKIFVSNDGTDILYSIISHRGKTSFSKEEPIYAGEVKEFWNVYELRFRCATAGVNYRVTEYKIDTSRYLSCATDYVTICGGSTAITQLVPIEKGVIHNTALPAIGTDFFAAALTPTNTPTMFRINVAISIVGTLTTTIIRGGNTQTVTLNIIPGPALIADGLYEFNIMVHSGDTINFRYSATGGTILIFRVTEVDAAVT